tara:strand:- start:1640 stop:1753 length:114 start_codon:yes stop_codon:yes gene_type:complete
MGTILNGADLLDVEGLTVSQLAETETDDATIRPLDLE